MEGDPRDASARTRTIGILATERSRWQHRAQLLSEVIGAFAEASLDYEQLLAVISRKLADVVGDLCSVLLSEEAGGGALSLVASHDNDPEVLALTSATFANRPMSLAPTIQSVLDSGEPYLLARVNPERIRDITTQERAAYTEQIGMHSMLLVALRARGNAIGVLGLVRHRPEQPPYDDHDRDLVQLLADHAAVAIVNARLLRRRDRELVLAKEAAESANLELEAFSYSVAHDLRAPLRAIDRFAGALEADCAAQLDDDGRHYLGRVRGASKRMAHLIEDLLTLSRVNHGELRREPVDVTNMARRIIGDLAVRSGREVDARVRDGLRATADPGLLQVLLENLLGNAWKFTARQPSATVELGSLREGEGTVFFVRDNGAGFDMKDAGKLFRPFQRLHSEAQFPGSGIGLATVHRIVGRHGGRVWAVSEPERGTTVFFTVHEQS